MGRIRLGAVAVAGCAILAVTGAALGVPGVARVASTTAMPGSAPPAGQLMARAGAVSASQQLTIQVWLKPDLAGAATFADAVAAPGSAGFHRYLSPAAYTAKFGPSAAHAASIAAWLTTRGLTQVHVSGGRDYVAAAGPVSRVESAFQVQISRYRVKGADGMPMVIQSNDGDVSVPASLAPDVLGVTGLSTAPTATPGTGASSASAPPNAAAKEPACSQYWAQHVQAFHPAYQGLTRGALPICGYSAGQLRAAYGATWADTGQGQTVALTEDEAPSAMFQTLADYARANHLPAPKPSQFRQTQAGSACSGGSASGASQGVAQAPAYGDEAQMDSEALYAMAPGATQLMVVGQGCDEDQALLDAADSVLTGSGGHPSASIVSNSWQIPLGEVPAQTVHAIDLRAAAEGVGMYFASGDTPGLTVTDSDPYVTAVGGTTLGVGSRNNRVFETGWSDDSGFLDNGKWTDMGISPGSGGGTSLVYRQPAYQKAVVPASMSRVRVGNRTETDRAVPDIAADADLDTGMLTGYIASVSKGRPGPYQTRPNAGTSLACPLIAGLVADAQQGRRQPFGFLNPLMYHLARTPAFHDILPVSRSTPEQDRVAYIPGSEVDVFGSQGRAGTQQVTAKRYDTMTGIGTPNGTAFITGLRRAAH